MCLSLSYFPVLALLLLIGAVATEAKTVTYDFNITWVRANPDGAFERDTIGVNNEWPLPTIRADVGDNIIVNVENGLGDQSTSLHFHGLYMNGSTHMDGPAQVSQCAIAPGQKFTYNFTLNQPGTYWYHSHSKGQYPDGLRAPFIVNDPKSPFLGMYDEEVALSVSDWYHDQMPGLIAKFMARTNPTGAEPVPNAALFNETQDLKFKVEPGRTYLFRMVNMGAFAGQYIWFENHNISIVEVDGVYTEPAEAEMVYLTAAQRISFLLTTKNETDTNYAFMGSMDTDLFDSFADSLQYNVTGWLVYDESKPLPVAAEVAEFNPYDDFTLVPHDRMPLLGDANQVVELVVAMNNLDDGANYAFFNNITYTAAKVPTLYTALSSGALATNKNVYGEFTHPFVLEKDEIVDIVINNDDPGKHPFHLHGHSFQTIWRSDEDAGAYNPETDTAFPEFPMRRDTLMVRPGGNMVMRFKADNPGVWLFHCHIEWHVDSGLIATIIESPLSLQQSVTIPQNHKDACAAVGVQTAGNAAGNTVDFLDLAGQNEPPHRLPDGWTAKGIVAMTFSCLAALLGLVAITWYGLADMGAAEFEHERRRIAEAGIPVDDD